MFKRNHNSNMPRFEATVWLTQFTFLYVGLLLLFLTLARVAFIMAYAGSSLDMQLLLDTFYWGARIDLKTASIICLLFYVIAQAVILIMPQRAGQLITCYRQILLVMMYFTLLLMLINHFYYQNFQNHIDIFMFEFLDWENTKAVSQAIWQDYPVIWGSLFLLLLCWGCAHILCKLQHVSRQSIGLPVKRFHVLYALSCLLLLMLAARGSVGTFPLMLNQISIAGDLLLNRAVANGPTAFVEATVEWRNMQTVQPVSEAAFKKAYQTWFEKPYTKGVDVFVQTPLPAVKVDKLPNVVVIQMESFGAHVASLQDVNNPILGALAKHKRQDYWFDHFLSGTKGTLNTIEKLLTNAGLRNISQSSYRKTSFATAPAALFQQLGYHTVYLTGGAKKWSNLDQFLPYQGFDEILDAKDIKMLQPDAEEDGSWGVFDEHTFAYVLAYLQKKHDKPIFIYVMTITNHSPYVLPDQYVSVPLHVPDAYQDKVFKGNMKKAGLVMQTYHYASNALGVLMDRIKTSALKNTTLVAATGDHYMRDLFNYYTESTDVLHQYTVPFYLYLPEYLQSDIVFDANRIGSHKDIFPTIFARLLQDQPLRSGDDILQQGMTDEAIGISEEFAISAAGAILNINHHPRYYHWADEKHKRVNMTSRPGKALKSLYAKHKSYQTLLRWNTVKAIEENKP